MALATRREEVVARSDGTRNMARVVSCCGQDLFCVYQLDGQAHLHLQCASCMESYCPGGDCRAPHP